MLALLVALFGGVGVLADVTAATVAIIIEFAVLLVLALIIWIVRQAR